jgi:hypothetical protein
VNNIFYEAKFCACFVMQLRTTPVVTYTKQR